MKNPARSNPPDLALVEILQWDSQFFGKKIARTLSQRLTRSTAKAIGQFCQANSIKCLYLMADPADAETLMIAQESGFRFVDIRMEFQKKDLLHLPSIKFSAPGLSFRPATTPDVSALEGITKGLYGLTRFYADPHFDRSDCDRLYQTWIRQDCSNPDAIVIVAQQGDEIVGYISCSINRTMRRGSIGLVGVRKDFQGRGIGNELLYNLLIHPQITTCISQMDVVTQGANLSAQRLYQKFGFKTKSLYVWFHRWL